MRQRSGEPEPGNGPKIRRLSRREWLKYGALVAGAATAGGLTWLHLGRGRSGNEIPEGYKKLELCEELLPNPAFCAKALREGGLLAWVRRKDESVLAYKLNAQGLLVWRLCNGRRSLSEIGNEFARRTGRSAREARTFLQSLAQKELVVQGGYLVGSSGFPAPVEERRYFRLVGGDEEWMG